MELPRHKTKIVCTLGPASDSPQRMRELIRAGMDVARLNFSHGDFGTHRRVIENLRVACESEGRRVTLLADLPGPKMRIGMLSAEPVELKVGDSLTLTTQDVVGDASRVSVSFPELPRSVNAGDLLFLNDGFIQLEVSEVKESEVVCRVAVGGELRSRKGLNLPGIDLGLGAFTERDRECLRFALEAGVDAVSQSFVEGPADIDAVRRAAAELGHRPFVIAKIERSRALERIDEIVEAADGIMIARGDLGVEVPIERIAVVQKDLIRRAHRRAKPVITATQMLESMVANRRPTRAEATDVANAILDGTDCVMLSAESAMGRYPVEAVAMLARIAEATEPQLRPVTVKDLFPDVDLRGRLRPAHLIALGVEASLAHASPAAVFVPTLSGETARSLSLFRLPVWIVALSSDPATCQHLQFCFGVLPVYETRQPETWNAYVEQWVRDHELEGDLALLTEGPSARHPDASHRMEIIELAR